jgi:hypothetical protein
MACSPARQALEAILGAATEAERCRWSEGKGWGRGGVAQGEAWWGGAHQRASVGWHAGWIHRWGEEARQGRAAEWLAVELVA